MLKLQTAQDKKLYPWAKDISTFFLRIGRKNVTFNTFTIIPTAVAAFLRQMMLWWPALTTNDHLATKNLLRDGVICTKLSWVPPDFHASPTSLPFTLQTVSKSLIKQCVFNITSWDVSYNIYLQQELSNCKYFLVKFIAYFSKRVASLFLRFQFVLQHLNVVDGLEDDLQLGELALLLQVHWQHLPQVLHVGRADVARVQVELSDLHNHRGGKNICEVCKNI